MEATPTICPGDLSRSVNDLMVMVTATHFRKGCGDWGVRGHYCLTTFVLPFFSETLNQKTFP